MSLHDWMDTVARLLAMPEWTPEIQEKARGLYRDGYGTRWAAHVLTLWMNG